MSSCDTEEVQVLLPKLTITEKMIYVLFQCSLLSSKVLKQLEDWIARLFGKLGEWQQKVIRWWKQEATDADTFPSVKATAHNRIYQKQEDPKHLRDSSYSSSLAPRMYTASELLMIREQMRQIELSNEHLYFKCNSEASSSAEFNSKHSFLFTEYGDVGLGDHFSQFGTSIEPLDRLLDQQSRKRIRAKIKQEFHPLEMVQSNQDIHALKKLLLVMAKVRASIYSYSYDMDISAIIFEAAHAKLSTEKQLLFRATFAGDHPNGKSFLELNQFLLLQVSNYYADLKMIDVKYEQYSRWDWMSQKNRKKCTNASEPFCDYCRMFGHLLVECPTIKEMVCFKCLQSGHKAKFCPDFQLYGRKNQQMLQQKQKKQHKQKNRPQSMYHQQMDFPQYGMDLFDADTFICFLCFSRGHIAKYCPWRVKEKYHCVKCDKFGHLAKYCKY